MFIAHSQCNSTTQGTTKHHHFLLANVGPREEVIKSRSGVHVQTCYRRKRLNSYEKLMFCDNYSASVHPRCWLDDRKGIRPVKTQWWGAGVVICLEQGGNLHTAHLMPLPLTLSCFSKIQIGFTFLVPAHPGSSGQRAVKRVL